MFVHIWYPFKGGSRDFVMETNKTRRCKSLEREFAKKILEFKGEPAKEGTLEYLEAWIHCRMSFGEVQHHEATKRTPAWDNFSNRWCSIPDVTILK